MSKLLGGYLVCDGRGYPVSFAVHHAPPQVEKVTIYRPLAPGPGPSGGGSPGPSGGGGGGVRARRESITARGQLSPAQALLVDNQAVLVHFKVLVSPGPGGCRAAGGGAAVCCCFSWLALLPWALIFKNKCAFLLLGILPFL